jgi:CHAT domain-containing protein
VPFDLVPIGERNGVVLIERVDISYLPTAALLRRKRNVQSRPFLPWHRELVAFGNPETEQKSDRSKTFEGIQPVQPLPHSSEEVLGIAHMVNGRSSIFLGSSNVKSTFLATDTRGVPILHVSTHAFADGDIPENSRILFSPEAASKSANYLFLREFYDLDLREVDLATLSACDTERGRLIRGEGVQAFSRALLNAGSRAAVTALWRVDDQATAEFMKQFYYNALQKHQTKAQALQSAKLKFLQSHTPLENPALWAGFVLSGDGLTTLPRFLSWSDLVLSGAIAVLVLTGGVWLLLRSRGRVNRIDRS